MNIVRRLSRFRELNLTLTKLFNYTTNKLSKSLKLTRSYYYPHRIVIEPTTACNLRCTFCPTGKGTLQRNASYMSFDMFKKIVDEGKNYLMEISFAGYGEPFLNNKTIDMIEYAKLNNIFVEVYTTLAVGTPLLKEADMERLIKCKLDKITVSVDSSKEETFQYYKRAGSLSETIEKLKSFYVLKDKLNSYKPRMVFQYVVFNFNESELSQAKVLARKLGMEFQPKTANLLIAGGDFEDQIKNVSKEYNRYDYKLKEPKCPWIWDNCEIFANGDVTSCCYDPHGEINLGNVNNETLKQIFNGRKYREFRRQFLEDSDKIPICSGCTVKYGSGAF